MPRVDRYFGSRSFKMPSSGAAMKIDEYEPVSRPMSSASENSRSATAPMMPEPTMSSDSTGSTAAMLVLSDRMSTWFIDTLIVSPHRRACAGVPLRVLLDLVEHHDRVVQREAQNGEERDDRGRCDLEAEERVDADADEHVVHHRRDRGQRPFATRSAS